MDSTVQVALIGIATTIVTTLGIVIVAVINNRRERGTAAESAMEKVLGQRITLRDEQIADLKADLADRDSRLVEASQTIAEKEGVIVELLAELDQYKAGKHERS